MKLKVFTAILVIISTLSAVAAIPVTDDGLYPEAAAVPIYEHGDTQGKSDH
jgi:hypothetical protein